MTRRPPHEWRTLVFKTKRVGDPVKVVLLYLADYMGATCTVSVPRAQIAQALGKSERRIGERIKAAHDAGLLDTKSPGYRGHTAVYEGLFPVEKGDASQPPISEESGTSTSPLSMSQTRPLSGEIAGPPGVPPLVETNLSQVAPKMTSPTDSHGVKSSQDERGSVHVNAADSFLLALENLTTDCPHGIPMGLEPAPWDQSSTTCPECHAARSKSDRDRWSA